MHRSSPTRRAASIILGVLLVGAGCQAGAPGALEPRIQVGRADAAEGAISIETDDWTYAVPLEGVTWIDEQGTRWTSGRPSCLAPGVSRQIRFAAVTVTVDGATWRPVVWVSCQ